MIGNILLTCDEEYVPAVVGIGVAAKHGGKGPGHLGHVRRHGPVLKQGLIYTYKHLLDQGSIVKHILDMSADMGRY